MMRKYRVLYGYRTDDGLNYSMSTSFDEVVVEAEDQSEARLAAIEAAYDKHGGHCSHVRPTKVQPCE